MITKERYEALCKQFGWPVPEPVELEPAEKAAILSVEKQTVQGIPIELLRQASHNLPFNEVLQEWVLSPSPTLEARLTPDPKALMLGPPVCLPCRLVMIYQDQFPRWTCPACRRSGTDDSPEVRHLLDLPQGITVRFSDGEVYPPDPEEP